MTGSTGLKLVISDVADAGPSSVPGRPRSRRRWFPTAGDRSEFTREICDIAEAAGVEALVLAGFMRILGPEAIARFPNRILNIHPSLLPAFPGVDAVGQALRAGVPETGVTVHFVDELVDHGPIIAQRGSGSARRRRGLPSPTDPGRGARDLSAGRAGAGRGSIDGGQWEGDLVMTRIRGPAGLGFGPRQDRPRRVRGPAAAGGGRDRLLRRDRGRTRRCRSCCDAGVRRHQGRRDAGRPGQDAASEHSRGHPCPALGSGASPRPRRPGHRALRVGRRQSLSVRGDRGAWPPLPGTRPSSRSTLAARR